MRSALQAIGILLVVWALGIQVHSIVGAWQDRSGEPARVKLEPEHAGHEDMPGMKMPPPEEPPPAWRIALSATLVAAAAVLLFWPVLLGYRWGIWALALVWVADIAPRLCTDHRCWVAYDPTQHGCHLFMRSVVLGTLGVILCAVGTPRAAAEGGRATRT
jgi:hypothetical protein